MGACREVNRYFSNFMIFIIIRRWRTASPSSPGTSRSSTSSRPVSPHRAAKLQLQQGACRLAGYLMSHCEGFRGGQLNSVRCVVLYAESLASRPLRRKYAESQT